MSLLQDWRGGFTLRFTNNPIFDEEWLLDDRYSTESELHFIGYDANLMPMENLSTTPEQHRVKVIELAKYRLRDVQATVWLDDVKLKDGDGQ